MSIEVSQLYVMQQINDLKYLIALEGYNNDNLI